MDYDSGNAVLADNLQDIILHHKRSYLLIYDIYGNSMLIYIDTIIPDLV